MFSQLFGSIVLFFVLVVTAAASHSQTIYPGQALNPLIDFGYCGPPKRDENGKIIRSDAVKAEFMRQHPCPSTGDPNTPIDGCTDWSMDHTRPLACGGCDSVSNLAWLHKSVKSVAGRKGFYPKDRIERKVYGQEPPIPDTDNCTYVTPERTLK